MRLVARRPPRVPPPARRRDRRAAQRDGGEHDDVLARVRERHDGVDERDDDGAGGGAVAGVAGVAPERAWRYAPGGPDEALTGTITTSCIAWADGTFTGAACNP